MERWANIYISMILEALPFILIGAIFSSIIQVYISKEGINKILPKNKFLAMIGVSFLGLIIPICECAIVPIAKSLFKKGVPLCVMVTFMLSVPIVNPVVIASTYYAFKDIKIVLIRIVGGIVLSLIIGFLMELLTDKNEEILKEDDNFKNDCDCGCLVDNYFYNKSKLRLCLEHSNREFFNIFKYYIFGSFLSSIFIVFLKERIIVDGINNVTIQIIIMMSLSFLLSLCSEADAFIAKGFLNYFSVSAIGSFLILGPMIDLKNAIMLNSYFKKGFSIKFILIVILSVLSFSTLLNYI